MNIPADESKLDGALTLREFSIAFAAYLAVAGLFAVTTSGVMRDDAYIFFQYARNLAGSGQLAFNPGEPSFGITSLLWTLVLTAPTWLGLDTVVAGKLLGALFGAGAAVLWAAWIREHTATRDLLPVVLAAALLPAVGAGRMVTGMETGLTCLLTGGAIYFGTATGRRLVTGAVCAGLLPLVRPDLALLTAGLTAWWLYRRQWLAAALIAGATLLLSGWWPLYLHTHIGQFLPPTAQSKLSVFLPESLGITYAEFVKGGLPQRVGWALEAGRQFATAAVSHLVLLCLWGASVVLALVTPLRRHTRAVLLVPAALFAGVMVLYLVMFPLPKLRYFAWMVPALTASAWAAIGLLIGEAAIRKVRWVLVGLLFLVLYPGIIRQQRATGIQHTRGEVAAWLAENTPSEARIALEPIGEVGYYSGRYIVDMGGLVSASTPPYLIQGFTDPDLNWEALEAENAGFLVTYDHDGFLGRLPARYPERFELLTYIPPDTSAQVRYRILRVVRDTVG